MRNCGLSLGLVVAFLRGMTQREHVSAFETSPPVAMPSRERCGLHGLILRGDGTCSRCARRADTARAVQSVRAILVFAFLLLLVSAGARGLSVLREARDARADAQRAKVAAVAQSGGAHVVMYTMAGCGACRTAKAWMTSRNVSYVERRIDTDSAARDELRGLGGRAVVPTTVVDGEVLVGFNPSTYETSLRAHGVH
jgi:glutaredoxin